MSTPTSVSAELKKRIVTQICLIVGVSLVLGLSFNSYNPIGIRFAEVSDTATVDSHPDQQAGSTVTVPTDGLAAQVLTRTNLSNVTWAEAKPLLNAGRAVLVDMRGRQSYKAGHITGAILLSFESTPAEIANFAAQYGGSNLIAYCWNPTCHTSEDLSKKLLEQYSCKSILLMKGGYAEWLKAEFGYDPTPTKTTWAEVEPLVKSGQVVLVDARPKAAYDAGHVPGAISLPESSHTPEQLAAFQKQYDPKTHIVVYCSDLKCSASMKLAILLVTWYNYQKVQYMPGGYQEWLQSQAAQAKPASG